MKDILIVDDERDIRELIKLRLEAETDFQIRMADDGDRALEMVKEKVPDLIIMDVLMPNLDGLTTIKELNRISNKKIPVVIVTGKAAMMEEAFRMEGACDFLVKPLDGKKLVSRVKEILKV